ncbi:hypothetical protein DL93DRAFT_2076145 [Clavulina sp. PMI_390]|nr:hypothetical protein DL93DRAFT_2076145 [Clavulina sp. PMI_390]
MHHRRVSSVLSAFLIIAPIATASSLFPRFHPHGQLGASTEAHAASNSRISIISSRGFTSLSAAHTDGEVDTVSTAKTHSARDSIGGHSLFAVNSPKSLLARRLKRKQAVKRVAKRHDLTDGYGSLPQLTDPNAVIDWTLSGYGKDGKTLSNGYGAVPASLQSVGLGSAATSVKRAASIRSNEIDANDGTSSNLVERGALLESLSAIPSASSLDSNPLLSGSLINAASGSGPALDTADGVPILGLASGTPPVSTTPDVVATNGTSSTSKRARIQKPQEPQSPHLSKAPYPANVDAHSSACDVQWQQCCGQVLSQSDIAGHAILNNLLGLNTLGIVGLQCLPLVRDAVGLYTCKGTPTCCNGGSTYYDGMIALNCTTL